MKTAVKLLGVLLLLAAAGVAYQYVAPNPYSLDNAGAIWNTGLAGAPTAGLSLSGGSYAYAFVWGPSAFQPGAKLTTGFDPDGFIAHGERGVTSNVPYARPDGSVGTLVIVGGVIVLVE